MTNNGTTQRPRRRKRYCRLALPKRFASSRHCFHTLIRSCNILHLLATLLKTITVHLPNLLIAGDERASRCRPPPSMPTSLPVPQSESARVHRAPPDWLSAPFLESASAPEGAPSPVES